MMTVGQIIAEQQAQIDKIDFSYVQGKTASPAARSTVFFGEELLTELRTAKGYAQAQTLLSLLKSTHNRDDFNFVYYGLRNKPNLDVTINRIRDDRYMIDIKSRVDDWNDSWFFFFKEDGQQFDPDALREIKNFQ